MWMNIYDYQVYKIMLSQVLWGSIIYRVKIYSHNHVKRQERS